MIGKELYGMLIMLALAGCIFLARFIYEKIRNRMRAEIKDELVTEIIAEATEAKFHSINADLQRHLKQDGIIKPQSSSEEAFQRWKAEREKREP